MILNKIKISPIPFLITTSLSLILSLSAQAQFEKFKSKTKFKQQDQEPTGSAKDFIQKKTIADFPKTATPPLLLKTFSVGERESIQSLKLKKINITSISTLKQPLARKSSQALSFPIFLLWISLSKCKSLPVSTLLSTKISQRKCFYCRLPSHHCWGCLESLSHGFRNERLHPRPIGSLL